MVIFNLNSSCSDLNEEELLEEEQLEQLRLEVESTQLQTAVEKPIIINYVDIDEVSDEVVKEVIIQIKEKRKEKRAQLKNYFE